jgi:hypothetical protein
VTLFSAATLDNILTDRSPPYEIVETITVAEHRWELEKRCVFTNGINFWAFHYRTPSTENQEWDPFCGEAGVECQQVRPVEKTIITYEAAG